MTHRQRAGVNRHGNQNRNSGIRRSVLMVMEPLAALAVKPDAIHYQWYHYQASSGFRGSHGEETTASIMVRRTE